MITSIDGNHIAFEDQDSNLMKFYSEFGMIDTQSGQGIQTFHNVCEQSENADKAEVSS